MIATGAARSSEEVVLLVRLRVPQELDEDRLRLRGRLPLVLLVPAPHELTGVVDRAFLVPLRLFLGAVAFFDLRFRARGAVVQVGLDRGAAGSA